MGVHINPFTGKLDVVDSPSGEFTDLTLDAGTASVPSISFDGDTNTGIYSPGADQLALSTNGTGRLFVDASGNVVIGQSVATGLLTLPVNNTISWQSSNVQDQVIYADGSSNLRFYTVGGERLRITSAGLVGVGTSLPSTSLDVRGIISLGSSNLANAVIQKSAVPSGSFNLTITSGGGLTSESATTPTDALAGSVIKLLGGDPTTDAFGGGIQYYANGSTSPNGAGVGNQHVFYTRSAANTYTERLRIDESGNVGIGSSTPGSYDGNSNNLVIANTGGNAGMSIVTSASGDGTISWADGATGNEKYRGSIGYNHTNDKFTISTAATSAVTIDSSQRVGIGTTTVSDKLHVDAGNITLSYADASTGLRNKISWRSESPYFDESAYIAAVRTAAAGATSDIVVATGNSVAVTEKVRITSDGKLLVGTSSDYAENVQAAFYGASNGGIALASGTNGLSRLMFADATAGNAGAYVGSIIYNHAEDSLRFNVNGGTERMRIDSNGRLLVGTSSAPSAGDGQYSRIVAQGYTGSATGHGYMSLARGQAAASISSGDEIGTIAFTDSAGYSFARINCAADSAAGTNDYPGRLVFSVTPSGSSSPTEALRITNDRYVRLASGSGGIQFNGDTAAANALDDYEEGTFTPVIVGQTTAGTGTYTTQEGRYVKIGRAVTFTLKLAWTAHTGTGIMQVSGLPFAASATGGHLYGASVYATYVDFGTSASAPIAYVDAGNDRLDFRGFINDANRAVPSVNSDASGSVLSVNGTYQV